MYIRKTWLQYADQLIRVLNIMYSGPKIPIVSFGNLNKTLEKGAWLSVCFLFSLSPEMVWITVKISLIFICV